VPESTIIYDFEVASGFCIDLQFVVIDAWNT